MSVFSESVSMAEWLDDSVGEMPLTEEIYQYWVPVHPLLACGTRKMLCRSAAAAAATHHALRVTRRVPTGIGTTVLGVLLHWYKCS